MLKLNGRASLVEFEPGRIVVEYGTRHFARNELVPDHILGAHTPWRSDIATMIAADFVAASMTERFGEVKNWPAMARDFVYPLTSRSEPQPVTPERQS